MPFRMIRFGVLAALVVLSSCATRSAYYVQLNGLVGSEKYADAAKLAEESREKVYGEKNALLYYLDRGMLQHLSGDYAGSNEAFEQAKKISRDLFTRSVTNEASTLLVSDNMRPYYGEDYERAMVNIFSALNYILLGNEAEALVEARQVDLLLKTLQIDYGSKSVYKEDAFARYLMGMIYENQGQVNDAFISYRKALDAYGGYVAAYGVTAPKALVEDALRTAQRLGFDDEVRDIKKQYPEAVVTPVPRGSGELVVLIYSGFSPEKIDDFFEISFGKGWAYIGSVQPQGPEQEQVEQARSIARSIASYETVRMAFPKFSSFQYRTAQAEAVAGELAAKSEVVQDIGAIARKGLEDRITRTRVRTIARSVIKFAIARNVSMKVEEKSGEATGWIVKKLLTAASTATELADKRSWRSLPDKILVARLVLPEGKQQVKLDLEDAQGGQVTERTLDVEITGGKKTFAVVRAAY